MSTLIEHIGDDFETVQALVGDLHQIAAEQSHHLDGLLTAVATSTEALSHRIDQTRSQLDDLTTQSRPLLELAANAQTRLSESTAILKAVSSRASEDSASVLTRLSGASEALGDTLASCAAEVKSATHAVTSDLRTATQTGETAAGRLRTQRDGAVTEATALARDVSQASLTIKEAHHDGSERLLTFGSLIERGTQATLPAAFGTLRSGAGKLSTQVDVTTSNLGQRAMAALSDLEEGGQAHARGLIGRATSAFDTVSSTVRHSLPAAVDDALSSDAAPRLKQMANDLTRTSMNVQNAAHAVGDIERHLPAVGELHDHVSSLVGKTRSVSARSTEADSPPPHMDMAIDHMDMAIDHMADNPAINHMEMRVDKLKDDMKIEHMEMRVDKLKDDMKIEHMEMRIDKLKDEMKIEHMEMRIDPARSATHNARSSTSRTGTDAAKDKT